MSESIYLDNNATTAPLPEILAHLKEIASDFANPSSGYYAGQQVRMKVEAARRTLSRLIGAKPAEIVFTSGGTESIATVFAQKWKAIVISTVEHSAVIQAARTAENRGITVFRAGVNRDGSLQEGVLRDCVEQARRVNGTGNVLVSLMLANNETGVIFPLEKLSGFIKKVDVYFHVDAVQCVGKIPVDVDTLNCDYLSLSAHKFHGLKGAGLLFRRHMAPLIPLIHGHQESGFRGGTENVVGIIAMAIAAKEVVEMGPSNRGMQQNRDSLEKQLMDSIPGLRIIGSGQHRLPNTSNMMFPRHDGTMLAEALSRRGLFVSTGSACSTGGQASHVLRAMGYSQREADSCLRFSLSAFSTRDEIDRAVRIVKDIVDGMIELPQMNQEGDR